MENRDEKRLSASYDGNPFQSLITKFIQRIMKFIRVLMLSAKNNSITGCLPYPSAKLQLA